MKKWTIYNDNANKDIEKRLMCQPQTFRVSIMDGKTLVTVRLEAGNSRLLEVLTEVVIERVFNEVAYKHMRDVGYTEAFTRSYLTRELMNEIFKTNWYEHIKEKIEAELNEAQQDGGIEFEWDLDAFSRFQTHKIRKEILNFMALGDEEVKEQLIQLALTPMATMLNEQDEEETETVENLTVELVREDGEVLIHLDEGWTYSVRDMEEGFAEVMHQSAYEEDSELYRVYIEGVVLIFLALIHPIESYVLDKEEVVLRQTLESAIQSFNLSTSVVTSQ